MDAKRDADFYFQQATADKPGGAADSLIYAQAAALISIAQSLATLAAEKQAGNQEAVDYWMREHGYVVDMLRDVLADLPTDLRSDAIELARAQTMPF